MRERDREKEREIREIRERQREPREDMLLTYQYVLLLLLCWRELEINGGGRAPRTPNRIMGTNQVLNNKQCDMQVDF